MNLASLSTKSSRPIRGTGAASLIAEVAAAPEARLLAGISGVHGSGKSALLNDIEEQYRAAGVRVSRGHELRPASGRTAVLVDDAHQLGDSALTRIHSMLDERDVNLVVAYGLWPQPPALKRLATALEQHHQPVVLGSLPRVDIAAHASAALGSPAPAALVDHVAELTGGMPWLVHRIMETLRQGDRRDFSTAPYISRGVMDQLGYELDKLDGELRELLLALTVGFDLSGPLPPALEQAGESIDTLVARGRATGVLLPDGRLVPLVRQAVLETTPAYRLRALQRALVDTFVADGRSLDNVARDLARAGLKDPRIARSLEHAGDHVLATEPALASRLYEEASAAGSDELVTAARRAQAASAVGDLDGAARIVDDLLTHENAPDLVRGVDVAAAVWAQRGMLARSAEMYRWLGPARIGSSAALAAVAMFGTGDRSGAEAMFEVRVPDGSPTLRMVAIRLMGQGIRDSIDGPTAQALPDLVRASDMMTASGVTAPLPEVPAALAALVALHSGELDVAESVIDGALEGEQCGPAARPRLLLLRAWAAMLGDRTDRARRAIAEATAKDADLAPRDELILRALEVGLARRADDAPALVRGWQRARESILHVPVDLYSLLPLGELLVAATRLRDSERLETHLAEAWALLGRLGNPPLWAIPLHWSAVQAAILTERPRDLAPHAAALVRASEHNHLAAVLAAAGRVWLSVLAGDFKVQAVEAAARGLASVGMTWDGSRLAGHAAPRTEERKDMARLLACARDLHPSMNSSTPAVVKPNEPAPAVRGRAARDETGMSAREQEVARLVLEGKTYWEIGETIFISPRTVEHHIARIRRRLGVETRAELLAQLRVALDHDPASV